MDIRASRFTGSNFFYPLFFLLLCFLFLWSRYIRRSKPDAGFALFESESLKWPGFVEFDDVNGKVLTYSAQDRSIFHHMIIHSVASDYPILNYLLDSFIFFFSSKFFHQYIQGV